MDPITLDATDADLSSTKATMGSHTDDAVYVSAHTMLFGPSSLFVTDDGVHDGDPCASSTRKNDPVANDLPAQPNKVVMTPLLRKKRRINRSYLS